MKKLLALVLALVLALSFAACGSQPAPEAEAPEADAPAAEGELITVTVAASPTPHAEILAVVKDLMAAEGYDLQVTEFVDYVQPNLVVDQGELLCNYFQHQPYLDDFNAENGTKLVSVAAPHYEPLGLYPGKTASLEELADGAKIAVPNDTTNEARALLMLEAEGLIKVNPDAGLKATVRDITENAKNLEIVELEAAQLARSLPDVDMAVINGNYAIDAGMNIAEDAIAIEAKDPAYANVIAVKEGNENDPGVQALVKALQSDEVRKFIDESYNGAVVAMF